MDIILKKIRFVQIMLIIAILISIYFGVKAGQEEKLQCEIPEPIIIEKIIEVEKRIEECVIKVCSQDMINSLQ